MYTPNEIMCKTVEVTINIKEARLMLNVAGYQTVDMSDDEIFKLALTMNECYGVSYNVVGNEH